jgi:hypothetical protein
MNTDKKNDRFEAYPKPTETDQQLKNQPEYIDQQPNDFRDKSVSDVPSSDTDVKEGNDPGRELKEERV